MQRHTERMEKKDDIVNELKQLAPTLAGLEKRNFYTVPNGYFAEFKANMLAQVKASGVELELKDVAPALLNVERKAAKEVPAGYFSSFSKDLLKQIRTAEVGEELSVIAPKLAATPKQHNLSIPANYFAQFPEGVMRQIQNAEDAKAAPVMPAWLLRVNAVVEQITAVVFKPRYSFAFAGMATMIIVAVMFTLKVEQQCADLECKMARLSTEELNTYLGEEDTDSYQDEVFEAAMNDNAGDVQLYKDVLQNVSDEELNNALLD